MTQIDDILKNILSFLACPSPEKWLIKAADEIPLLLIDHAHCEKKAASAGLSLIHSYPEKRELLDKMGQLVREEVLHFEQVLGLMDRRGIALRQLKPANYASFLRKAVSNHREERLIDLLIIGAIIEARSCERFFALIPYVDDELAKYYRSLLRAEGRHFNDYLHLAKLYLPDGVNLAEKIARFTKLEGDYIQSTDTCFRFHSGLPA